MNTIQKSKHKRDGIVLSVFKRYDAEVKSIPALARKVARFEEIYNQIEQTHPIQASDRKGITNSKNLVREDVTLLGLTLAGALHSYADETGNADLAQRMNLTATSFNRLPVENFKAFCLEIVNEARKHGDKLADYGANTESIEQFATASTTFKEAAKEPRNAVVKISNATMSLADMFNEMEAIMASHFDKLIVGFQTKNPNFYREYTSAKIIEDHPARSRKQATPPNTIPTI